MLLISPAATCSRPRQRLRPTAASRPAAAALETHAEAGSAVAGLVLGLGAPGAFDSHSVGGPTVKCFLGDNERRWLMYYQGRAAPAPGLCSAEDGVLGEIGVAVSEDGVAWRRGAVPVETMSTGGAAYEGSDAGVVLSLSEDWWTFDTAAVGQPDVQVISSGSLSGGVSAYWMFYAGVDYSEQPALGPGPAAEGRLSRLGLALSQNGRNWARIEGAHHTHAVFDAGAPGEWDARGCWAPQVVVAGARDLRLYYASPQPDGRWAVGTAASPDGLAWTKRGLALAGGAGGAAAPNVHRLGAKSWLMFFEAVAADGRRCIRTATSSDGWSWAEVAGAEAALAAGDAGAWDAGGVGSPCALPEPGGGWRLYYEGHGAEGTTPAGVGMAVAQTLVEGVIRFTRV